MPDNHSRSARGVLCDLHYQIGQPQSELVCLARSSVFDVAVDIRGPVQVMMVTLSAKDQQRLPAVQAEVVA
ncbi:dTDP-4-dehydrorhamnose 3,5-epimerase [Hylemonella gracilis ATCC 19624]|uniref:dTDP-4-dehydrorhamnose 3,5-epimerase n=1 Tax=Hylemonella gracilis ATCC 19624 TaxID=887062 RepID=F3KSC6_9BURK|nr:dTDP-4-dehydrorhamnose 3,5-epimerase [Hylemonella gracilis ATCC 19624]